MAGRFMAWLLRAGERRWAAPLLFAFAACEATLFPAPSEALLLALCVSRPRRAWRFVALCVLGSVAGAAVAYVLGARLFADVGVPLLGALGLTDLLPRVEAFYRENMLLALTTSGYTPIPYLLYTIAAGHFGLPLDTFFAGSALGRTLKYLPIAGAAVWLGTAARPFLERHARWAALAITLVLALLVLWRA